MTRQPEHAFVAQPAARRRVLPRLVIVLLLLGLGACSSTRIFYENLDWLAYEAMDDRFAIRSDQEDWVKASLDDLHGMHRMTQLPAYRQTLEGLAIRVAGGLDARDLIWLDSRVEQHRRTLVDLVVPELARFLADLDDTQLARYVEASTEAIDEAAEPLGWSAEKRRAHRLDTYVDRIEAWTGELSTAQLKALELDVASIADIREEWIAQRRKRLDALASLLATRPGADAIETELRGLWGDLDAGYPAGYAARRRALKQQIFELVMRLDAGLTPQQRAHVRGRLEDYIKDIDIVVVSR